jgi:arabinose-5-phosphate isomerase
MTTNLGKKIREIGQKVLIDESEAIKSLINTIGEEFENLVEYILNTPSKVLISGIGKSAIIAQKIVATLNSTGTTAVFMHAADALHGDLGLLEKTDIVIFISKSGNTPELKVLVPLLSGKCHKIAAIVSDTQSYLAKTADILINAHVSKEACPLDLAPTSSTTVALAIGDALAMALLTARSFTAEDFASFHPGGSLGKKLYLKVSDLSSQHEMPAVHEEADIKQVILEISKKRLGATAVLDSQKNVKGIITDGDLRRMLYDYKDFLHLKAIDIASTQPKTIKFDDYAINALNKMREHAISQLLVTQHGKAVGFIHMHDLLREGIV